VKLWIVYLGDDVHSMHRTRKAADRKVEYLRSSYTPTIRLASTVLPFFKELLIVQERVDSD
jgi:hypothetical protein